MVNVEAPPPLSFPQPEETEADLSSLKELKRTKKSQRSIAAMNLKDQPKNRGELHCQLLGQPSGFRTGCEAEITVEPLHCQAVLMGLVTGDRISK